MKAQQERVVPINNINIDNVDKHWYYRSSIVSDGKKEYLEIKLHQK